jgi:acetyl/propionyl-CoA carboxylase alpha subunit
MAVTAARAAGLYNAATAEFLFDPDRQPWFLEVNARLQVEHGVTELVTGLDLVAEQLWIAAGAPLSDEVHAAAARLADPGRHAIEVRLSAEDPSRAFAPTPGRIGRWIMPAGPGVRVDTAIRGGERVVPDYDPMIAKIMTVAPDRTRAIQRMRRALAEVEVTGIQTTLPFHRALMHDAAFVGGELSIDHVAERWDGEAERDRVRPLAVEAAAAAAAAAAASDGASARASSVQPAAGPSAAGPSLHKDGRDASAWRRAGRAAGVDRWPR